MIKKLNLWSLLIWLFIPMTFIVLLILSETYLGLSWKDMSGETRAMIALVSLLPCLVLKIEDMNHPSSKDLDEQRKKVQSSSEIPKELLRDKPIGGDFILGERNGKYVCVNLQKIDTHFSILGTSGTGKTSCLLLNNLILNESMGALILDVKDSELFRKSTKIGDPRVERFDPSFYDGSTWGFDPFYNLGDNPSEYEILDAIQLIANSLISIPSDAKDPFWKQNAKNLFMGMSIYFYGEGKHDLISIVDAILGAPIEESISTILSKVSNTSSVYKYLVQFGNMAIETLSGIYSELASNLTIFANHPGIRYAFGDKCKRKITPLDLEEKKRIFLCVNQTQLTTMDIVVRLILDVMMYGLQMRGHGKNENELEPIFFVIDELPQLLNNGPLSQLIQGLRVLRSSKVRMILAYQTKESLMSAYSENQVIDLVSNTNYMVVLNGGNSTNTMRMICDLVGSFYEKNRSFQGKNHKQTTISFEDEKIIKESDINKLPLDNNALVLSPSGWMIVKKSPYYKCKYIAPKSREIELYNKEHIFHSQKKVPIAKDKEIQVFVPWELALRKEDHTLELQTWMEVIEEQMDQEDFI